MGFRKSIKSGQFRMTFSKSGISTSVGVKGARLTTSKRGTYITLGGGGVYYRKRVSGNQSIRKQESSLLPEERMNNNEKLDEITTVDANETTASTFKDFIDEIQEKVKRPMYSNYFIIGATALIPLLNLSDTFNLVLFIISITIFIDIRKKDKVAKEIEVNYDFEDGMDNNYNDFIKNVERFSDTQKTWRIIASKHTTDYKKNAGANNLVNRVPVIVDKKSKVVKSNVEVFRIKTGKTELLLLPDRMLFIEGKKVGPLSYDEIEFFSSRTNFIEEGSLPKDSKKVGTTWKYVNRNGNPDKRFKNNKQLAVMEYGQLDFKSDTGVNYLFMTSNVNSTESLYNAVYKYKA